MEDRRIDDVINLLWFFYRMLSSAASRCWYPVRAPYLRLVFTSDGVVVGAAIIRRVERYDLVKIKPTESEAEH